MNLAKTLILAALVAASLGCGYSKPATTPAAPGTMPTITELSPASVAAGGEAFSLEVNGANFSASATINFNGAAMNTTFTNSGKITAAIPASAISNSGTVPVTVTNPGTPGGPYGGGIAPATSTPMDFVISE